jgi:acyl-[acyl-carrier-protein]-phospholipid O-acyltransferase/long-chain-fatty-acid--[acyl-carrier-protein] ligase
MQEASCEKGGERVSEAMGSDEAQARDEIRRARGKFAAMAATYFLGAFNDNFYKQAMMLIAIGSGRPEFQGYAAVVFTLPFVVFAAPAGWMADRFSKRKVVIWSKALELAAMIFGAVGIWTVNWWLVFVMLAIMALQSAIFSPSLNGSIPELYPASYVTKANGYIKAFSVAAILAGIASAGVVLETKGAGPGGIPAGRFAVGAGVILIALLGVAVSIGVAKRPAASPGARFPWTGPVDTLRTLWETRRERLLAFAIPANAYFWFLGLVEVLVINVLGLQQFGLSEAWTSYLVGAQLVGIAIGGIASGRIAKGERWYRVVAPAALATGVVMAAVGAVPFMPVRMQLPALFALFAAAGAAGGIVIIPLESFIQVKPAAERKGAVISAANFAAFGAMLASGPVANVLNERVTPTTSFAVIGAATMLVSGVFFVFLGREGKR